MGSLLYSAITSLDGFIEDESGSFDWAVPGDEAHAFINDLMRDIGTYLYGRRLYEVMEVWERDPSLADQSPVMADFAQIWQAADKVVYSRTLETVSTARTRLERDFDPAGIRHMKDESERDLVIGGAELAAEAFQAGLVDECHMFLAPIAVGGGKRSLPAGLQVKLQLIEQRSFPDGIVYLHYRTSK